MDNNEQLSADEQAYFDNRGTLPEPTEKADPSPPAREAQQAPQEPQEPSDYDEPAADGVDEGGEDKPKQDFVSHKALHAERERRRRAEQAAREREAELIRMQERLALMERMQGIRQQPQDEPQDLNPPKPEEDLLGAIEYTQKQLQEIRAREAQEAQQRQYQEQTRGVVNRYRQDASQFMQEAPDFKDAYEFVVKQRDAVLRPLIKDPVMRDARIKQEEFEAVVEAYRMGRNPAEVMYEMAKELGYSGSRASVPSVPQERREEGQRASRTLSGNGGSPTGPMTAQRLLDMPEAEFKAYLAKNPSTVDRLLGKP